MSNAKLTIIPPRQEAAGRSCRAARAPSRSPTARAAAGGSCQGRQPADRRAERRRQRYLAEALAGHGCDLSTSPTTTFVGDRQWQSSSSRKCPLFLGNAGTATRFLTAAAAPSTALLSWMAIEHMRKRPIGPLVDALRSLGIDARAETGCPPVTVQRHRPF